MTARTEFCQTQRVPDSTCARPDACQTRCVGLTLPASLCRSHSVGLTVGVTAVLTCRQHHRRTRVRTYFLHCFSALLLYREVALKSEFLSALCRTESGPKVCKPLTGRTFLPSLKGASGVRGTGSFRSPERAWWPVLSMGRPVLANVGSKTCRRVDLLCRVFHVLQCFFCPFVLWPFVLWPLVLWPLVLGTRFLHLAVHNRAGRAAALRSSNFWS